MYSAKTTVERIQGIIRSKKLIQKSVLKNCGISENTLNQMTDNKGISSFYLAKISDELDCSVDYLLGRTDNPQSHKCLAVTTGDVSGNYNNVIGNSSGINITNLSGQSENATALLKKFSQLDIYGQAEVLVFVNNLLEKTKEKSND